MITGLVSAICYTIFILIGSFMGLVIVRGLSRND